MAYKNPDDQTKAWREHYARNKGKYIARTRRRRQDISAFLRQYKADRGCKTCPQTHPAALTFHHRKPSEKDITVALIRSRGWGMERILLELEKCDVLCANCHAILHDKLRNGGPARIRT